MPAEIHVFRCLEDNIGALVHDPATRRLRRHRRARGGADPRAPRRDRLDALATSSSPIAMRDHVQGIAALKRRTGCRVVAPREGAAGRCRPSTPIVARGRHGPCRRAFRRMSGKRPAIAPTTSPTGSPPTGRCSPATPCSRSAAAASSKASYAEMWRRCSGSRRCPTRPGSIAGTTTPSRMRASRSRPIRENAALKARAAEAESRRRRRAASWCRSTIGEEKATNPFLRAGEPALARAVEQGGRRPGRGVPALREWKNRF